MNGNLGAARSCNAVAVWWLFIASLAVVGLIAAACNDGEETEPTVTPTELVHLPTDTPVPAPQATDTPSIEGRVHFEDTELGFAFDYPDYWELLDPKALGGQQPRVAVGTLEEEARYLHLNGAYVQADHQDFNVPESDLAEFLLEFDGEVEQLASQLGGALEEKAWTEIGGRRGRRYVMNIAFEGVPTMSEMVFTVRGDLLLTIGCEGGRDRFEEVRTGCQLVFDSFEFTSR